MAPPNADKTGSKAKLTLETLAQYDDLITDALVDKVYYWTIIRKNRGGRFTSFRGLHEEDVADILRRYVIWDKDPADAVEKLLQLPGLRKFVTGLKNKTDQEQFKRHLRRYVNIYLPDCPFEVTTTNRYTITSHEASVTARRDINAREEIKYLTGVQVAMTEEQEKTLELQRKDFSLVYSSRRKTRSLFLGPARFANHDCDPNARLATKGYDGMQIVAVKPIDGGEEITVSYGDDYFGDDNEECLCHTCEKRQQNGWAPMKRVEESDEEADDTDSEQTNPGISCGQAITSTAEKRKRDDSKAREDIRSSTPPSKRVKIDKSTLSKYCTSDQPGESARKKAHRILPIDEQILVSSVEDPQSNLPTSTSALRQVRSRQRNEEGVTPINGNSSPCEPSPQSRIFTQSPKSSNSTDATSIDEEHVLTTAGTAIKIEPDTMGERPTLGVATVKDELTTTTVNTPWPSLPAEQDYISDLSELSSSLEFDSDKEQIVKRKPRPTLRATRSKSRFEAYNLGTPVMMYDEVDVKYVENKRKPGDYMMAKSLLAAKYSKWVECYTCEAEFVQQDGYNTRKDCPRCERHSKLYGFAWPKTEKEGKHDKEERILDHRTVHRFVDPEEERELKRSKTKKILKEHIRERFSTPNSARTSMSASVEIESGRPRRTARKTM